MKRKAIKNKKSGINFSKNWLTLILFVGAWLLYGNTLNNDFNMSDDYITINHPLTSQGISAIPLIFKSSYYQDGAGVKFGYRPVVVASMAIENEFFGESPTAGHFFNVLIYSLTVILVFFWILGMQKSNNLLLPFIVALFFLIHPLHTDVVNSIKNRDELLALFFGLICSILIFKGVNHKKAIVFIVFGTVAYALALMSKLSALPFAVIVPVGLALSTRSDIKYLLGSSISLAIISYALLPPLPSQYSFIIMSGLILFPLLLFLIHQDFSLNNTHSIIAVEERKNNKSRFQPGPDRLLLLGGGIALIFSFLIFDTRMVYVSLIMFWSLTLVALLLYKSSGRVILLVFLALLGMYAKYTYHVAFIHLIAILPLLFYVLSEGWKKKIVASGILSSIIAVYFLIDILYAPQSFEEIILPVIAGLYILAGKKGKYAFPAAMMMLILLVVLQLIIPNGKVIVILIIAISSIYTALHYQGKWSFPSLTILILFLGLYAFIKDFPPPINNSGPQVQLEIDAVEAARSGKRILDYSESPILYEPSRIKKAASSLLVMGRYLRLMVIPYPLVYYYGYDVVPVVNFMHWEVWITILVLLGICLILFKFLFSNYLLSLGFILMMGGVFQFSNFILPVAGIMGVRLIYIASLGFCLVIAMGMVNFPWKKFMVVPSKGLNIVLSFMIALSVISAFYIIDRNKDWKNTLSLFKHDIKYLDNSVKAHHLLASQYFRDALLENQLNEKNQKLDLAISHFKKSIDIYANFPYAYYDLGNAYLAKNDYTNALEAFISATTVDTHNADAFLKAATLYENDKDYSEAERYYLLSIDKDSSIIQPYINLSTMYFEQGIFNKGMEICEKGLKIDPNNVGLINNYGNALANSNQYATAITYFEKIYIQKPNNQSIIGKLIYLYEKIENQKKADSYRLLVK